MTLQQLIKFDEFTPNLNSKLGHQKSFDELLFRSISHQRFKDEKY